jgi:hypothetical protein
MYFIMKCKLPNENITVLNTNIDIPLHLLCSPVTWNMLHGTETNYLHECIVCKFKLSQFKSNVLKVYHVLLLNLNMNYIFCASYKWFWIPCHGTFICVSSASVVSDAGMSPNPNHYWLIQFLCPCSDFITDS